mgnify:CR=1 FL=1
MAHLGAQVAVGVPAVGSGIGAEDRFRDLPMAAAGLQGIECLQAAHVQQIHARDMAEGRCVMFAAQALQRGGGRRGFAARRQGESASRALGQGGRHAGLQPLPAVQCAKNQIGSRMQQVLAATDAPQAEDRTIAHAAAHLREAQVRQPVFGADPDRMRLARIQARIKSDIASPSVVRWQRAACGVP